MLDTEKNDWLSLERACPYEPIRDGERRVLSRGCHPVKTSQTYEGYSRQQHQEYSDLVITALAFFFF